MLRHRVHEATLDRTDREWRERHGDGHDGSGGSIQLLGRRPLLVFTGKSRFKGLLWSKLDGTC